MTCPVCGGEKADEMPCPQCGHPQVPEPAAKALAEARSLVAVGALDHSIRLIHSAIKAAPDSPLPHLRLAQAYERKVQGGETALAAAADREFREALRLAPADRDVHLARLGFWVRAGRLAALRAEYRRRREELPFAEECLKILDGLERSAAIPDAMDVATGAASLRARYIFWVAGGLAAIGVVELGVVIHAAINDDNYVMMADMDFFFAVAGMTAASILVLEGFRTRKGGKSA